MSEIDARRFAQSNAGVIPFMPSDGTTLAVSGSSARTELPEGSAVIIFNPHASVDAHFCMGDETVTCSTSRKTIPFRTEVIMSKPVITDPDNGKRKLATHCAGVSHDGTAITLQIEVGDGRFI